MARIFLFDTTLRDGAQTQGVDFSINDKQIIAGALDQLKIDYIEGGWPGANPTDEAFFQTPPQFRHARFVAFGMTRRSGRSAENDPALVSIVQAQAQAACLVAKSWDFHVDVALGIEREENLAMIGDSIRHVAAHSHEAMLDCEHYFDGYKANPDYALACAKAALEAGARWIVLCDTNGGTLPDEIARIVRETARHIPAEQLGIHAHNDTGNAIANSLAAVEAGAHQVQGTINGLGERCGNADIIALIAALALKTDHKISVDADGVARLTWLSRLLDAQINRAPNPYQPFVGRAAFAHKGGLHASAVVKDPRTYEHIEPALVGNRRHVVTSSQAGRSNIRLTLETLGIELDAKAQTNLLARVKELEHQGFSYDGAEASLELLVRRQIGEIPAYFEITRFRVIDERRYNALGEVVHESEATITVAIKDRLREGQRIRVARGNGPVNSLDQALRLALVDLFPAIAELDLRDYKVRILPPDQNASGTEAITRVTVESASESLGHWSTVGVSTNVIEASMQALMDSYIWFLYKQGKGKG